MIVAVIDLIRQLGYVGLFAVVLAENLFPPIPSEVVLPFAGWEIAPASCGRCRRCWPRRPAR